MYLAICLLANPEVFFSKISRRLLSRYSNTRWTNPFFL